MTSSEIGGKGLLIAGLLFGFFIIPPLANANPKVVNGFLLLILVGILLMNYERWLPLLDRFNATVPSKAPRQTYKQAGGKVAS